MCVTRLQIQMARSKGIPDRVPDPGALVSKNKKKFEMNLEFITSKMLRIQKQSLPIEEKRKERGSLSKKYFNFDAEEWWKWKWKLQKKNIY